MSKPNLSAEVLISALEQAIDATVIIDDKNHVIFFNSAAENLWGLDKKEVLGQNVNVLVPMVHRGSHDAFVDRSRSSNQNRIVGTSREVEFTRSDGEYICGELSLSKVVTDDGRIFFMGVMKNVTNESQQRKILILQNDVLQALASDMLIQDVADLLCRRVESFVPGTVAVLMLMLIAPDGQLRVLSSPTLPKRYRASLESLYISSSELEKLRLDSNYATRLVWDSYRSLGISLGLQQCFCTPVCTRSGQVKGIFALYARENQGRNTWPQRIVDSCIPFCALAFEQNATQEHISHLANFDSLTGLLNRSSVHKVIESMINKQDGNRQFAIFMLDIDRFRDINDALGHVYADQFLVEIAARIRAISLDGYVISRSGGDEFVVVVPNCPNKEATEFAQRLLATISKPLQIGQNTLTISCSIGISSYPDNGPDSESLLSTADVALRQAKEDGRGTFCFANLEKNQVAQDRLVLGSALRDSL
ncbi:diguanylate cyclase domain-containing protein, partial [Komagataeibacter swingsii]